ncbi:macro domain-containing protein, partial [Endozoicomonas sp. ONNA2]|uniref:macro domain-containing protein n=1 Tax=Endozoicomonas sp. ONNA2 TaxID=2828741 RepID=UPI0021480244
IVNSVDLGKTLSFGIAKVIKDKFGTDYQRASENQLLDYGICATYYCSRFNNPPDLSNCHAVFNVMIPPSTHPDFDVQLKNAFIAVFKEAMGNKLDRVFCPLLGCGIAKGSGTRLATAVLAAKEFFKPSGCQLPELILVGRSSEARDIQAGKDFARQWQASGQYRPATGSALTSAGAAATAINTATTSGSGNNVPRMLIPGQLGIVMYADNGMFGYARELSKQGKLFDLVNAANSQMSHRGGIAQRFSRELGAQFDSDTASNAPVPTGACYTTGSYGYSDPKSDLHHCQYIHNVVAPNKKEYEVSVNRPGAWVKTHFQRTRYEQDFTSAFVSLLLAAMTRGSDTIVSCFIGCAIFGGSGEDMARALHGAYQKLGIPLLKLPKLILVGWRGADQNVYDDFIQTFERLNIADPVCLPSGKMPASASPAGISGTMPRSGAIPKKTSPDFLSGAALFSRSMHDSLPPASHSPYSLSDELANLSIRPEPPAKVARTTSRYALSGRTEVSGSGEIAASAFSGSKEVIDCGVCYESQPKEGSQQYQGVLVCADCTKEYPDLNLHSSTKLAEEYAAINYSPLEVTRWRKELPGYPGVGRIVVHIAATAPAELSGGRTLDETRKCETHYLPDNKVGNELLRLLEVLHEEKLIYKIDQSNTTGKFAITFNFHLKTSDTGGVPRHGYPDRDYPCRAADQIVGLGKTHALEKKLDVTKLLNLLSDRSS